MSLFGQTATANKPLFGGLNTQQPAATSTFGGFGALGASQAQQPQQQQAQQAQPQQQQTTGILGSSIIVQGNQNGKSLWNPGSLTPREANIPDQIKTITEKWDTGNQNCVFKHYFYNKVDEANAPYYRPSPSEDEKAWEEALAKKPGPGYIPVLCIGFAQLGERIKLQQAILAQNNRLLHEINAGLDAIMDKHNLDHMVRITEANRRHQILKKRCIALATKVQVLRNRGYSMGGEEEDLKVKLQDLEKKTFDPGLSARSDEIWSRMLVIRERARVLKEELAKRYQDSAEEVDPAALERANKFMSDLARQLTHLRGELEKLNTQFKEWQEEQGPRKR